MMDKPEQARVRDHVTPSIARMSVQPKAKSMLQEIRLPAALKSSARLGKSSQRNAM